MLLSLQLHRQQKGRLSLISSLYQQGLTQAEIAQQLKVHQSTVGRDIKRLGLGKKKRTRLYEPRPSRYEKFRYCIHCKWIPIAQVISKICKDIEYSYCPNCSAKLRENAKKSQLNHKRKKVKRL